MSLGEAFIEVRADLRPFVRDLDRQVQVALQRVETGMSASLTRSLGDAGEQAGREAGERAGRGLGRSMRRSILEQGRDIFVSISGVLAGALDRGISALPAELKAAIVGGILAATPLIGAALTGAIVASVGVGLAGIGVLLGSQFTSVQDRWSDFFTEARDLLVRAASSFGPVIIRALDALEGRLIQLEPFLARLFDISAEFVEPLFTGLLDGLEAFVLALHDASFNLQPFMETLADGFASIAATLGDAILRLSQTGEAGRRGLQDLITLVNLLIIVFTGLIALLTSVWQTILLLNPALAIAIDLLGRLPGVNTKASQTNQDYATSFNGVIAQTKAQEKAAKDLVKALDGIVEATYRNIQVDIDFERSLDRISESLRENGRSLDIHSEKGRQNVESFISGLKAAEERALNRVKVQGQSAQQAAALYNQEIEQLRAVARQAGVSDAEFQRLFGDIVAVSELRISSETMGVDDLAAGLNDANAQAFELLQTIQAMRRVGGAALRGGLAGLPGFADGDIVNRPTLGVFGEAGPEVIVPLTKPARAAELAQQSGLAAMLGLQGTQVMVFIGSEQLEARMVKVVERNNQGQAAALSQGTRRF